jgi:hypothetical protein
MAPRVNYVLCAWSGKRRTPDVRREVDGAFYLRTHLRSLRDLRHRLDQITLMVPENQAEPPEFRELLRQLPPRVRDTPIVVMERPNIGLSYGSLSDCFARYRCDFDYYFFMEDDYVFTQHEFDRLHVEEMEADPKCGYLCGLAWTNGLPLHAGIANGIMRATALERVFSSFGGKIPHANDASYRLGEATGQVGQSQAILSTGYTLKDWKGKYRVLFREHTGDLKEFHSDQKVTSPLMMRPV